MSSGLPDLTHPTSGQFWRAAQENRLELSFCSSCGECVWYPQSPTPCCHAELEWKAMGSSARLITWTEVKVPMNPHFAAPYTVALIEPDDAPGARVVSRLINDEAKPLACDMTVRLDFTELLNQQNEGFTAPVFRPA